MGSLHSHGKSAARSTAWLGRDLVESEAESLGCDCERHCLDVAGIEQNNYQYQEGESGVSLGYCMCRRMAIRHRLIRGPPEADDRRAWFQMGVDRLVI